MITSSGAKKKRWFGLQDICNLGYVYVARTLGCAYLKRRDVAGRNSSGLSQFSLAIMVRLPSFGQAFWHEHHFLHDELSIMPGCSNRQVENSRL